MALYYASGSQQPDSGKFQHRRRPGIEHGAKHQHGEFRFELLSMESPAPTKRLRYHVRIFNKQDIRVGYLRDFSSPAQAMNAAKRWVDERA